jgi:MFS family permease
MESASHWLIYLPVMVLSMLLMVPFIVVAERRRRMKPVFLGAILALGIAQFGLYFMHQSLWGLAFAMLLYFTAFNLLEATLPSLVSKIAPAESKGTAMGVYSTSQFAGAFVGGLLGGWVHGQFGLEGVFLFTAAAALLWWLSALRMAPPSYLASHLLRVGELDEAQAAELQLQLREIKGVGEAVVVAGDGIAYLKIDKNEVDMAALDAFSAADG